MQEESFIKIFIFNLKEEVRTEVLVLEPKTMAQTIRYV
jgi:hypothetical protein